MAAAEVRELRRVIARTALTLLAMSGLVTGCGGASGGHPENGSTLFTEACGTCHSLVGRESPRRQGGDLLDYRFGHQVMFEFAREMPVRRRLDAHELQVIVDYVVGAERRGRTR